ncbi:MAG: hypothetical protein K2O78_02755 [Muribaculaceae bacterium]|nr:hypothetical protein [Muribaculaceae bacterium]MDE7080554.1 hypothetical protein [Muribaculaceae bacterium]
MKGFGARERFGLIILACVLTVMLGIGPVADRLGCTRRSAPVVPSVDTAATTDSAAAASPAAGAVPADSAPRTGRKSGRRNTAAVPSDTTRRGKNTKRTKKAASSEKKETDTRRNYLDETL